MQWLNWHIGEYKNYNSIIKQTTYWYMSRFGSESEQHRPIGFYLTPAI